MTGHQGLVCQSHYFLTKTFRDNKLQCNLISLSKLSIQQVFPLNKFSLTSFKPRLTVTLPDFTLLLIFAKFPSIAWAFFKASLSSFIIWSGTLSFLYFFSHCLAFDLVSTAAQKLDKSGSLDPSMFPITTSYYVLSMHKASVCPEKNVNVNQC